MKLVSRYNIIAFVVAGLFLGSIYGMDSGTPENVYVVGMSSSSRDLPGVINQNPVAISQPHPFKVPHLDLEALDGFGDSGDSDIEAQLPGTVLYDDLRGSSSDVLDARPGQLLESGEESLRQSAALNVRVLLYELEAYAQAVNLVRNLGQSATTQEQMQDLIERLDLIYGQVRTFLLSVHGPVVDSDSVPLHAAGSLMVPNVEDGRPATRGQMQLFANQIVQTICAGEENIRAESQRLNRENSIARRLTLAGGCVGLTMSAISLWLTFARYLS